MEMISNSSFLGAKAGGIVFDWATGPGVNSDLDNGGVVLDKETGVAGDISGVAFTVGVIDTGGVALDKDTGIAGDTSGGTCVIDSGGVVLDKDTGVTVIVLNIGGGVASMIDVLDTGGLVFDGETGVLGFDSKTSGLVCDK